MEEKKEKTHHRLRHRLGAQFLEGLLVVVPIGITIWILIWIFSIIDGFLQPIIRRILGHDITGVGFGVTLLIIYLAGVVAENVIGRRIIRYGESLLAKVPIFRYFYTGVKQLLESFSAPGKGGFSQVVLVEFPRKGMRAVGFVTSELPTKNGEKLFSVLIPTTPNPTTGFLEIVREEDIIRTNLSIEDAIKMVVSGGANTSTATKLKLSGTN